MKTIVKICIGISSVLLLLGMAFIGIGFLLGVTPAQLVYAGRYPGRFFARTEQNLEILDDFSNRVEDTLDDLDDNLNDPEPLSGLSGSNPAKGEEYYEFRDIQSLELELGLCELQVHAHDQDYIAVSADRTGNYFRCSQEGSALILTDNRPASTISDSMKQALVLDLTLPRQVYDSFDLELGAGNLMLNDLSADSVEIDNGAGNLTLNKLSCRELDLNCGAGELKAESLTASREADIELGTGTAVIAFFDGETLNLDCAVGSAEVTAAGSEQDYNYQLDGLGSIYVNHHLIGHGAVHNGSHHEDNDHLDVHNGAGRQINIQCALGTVDLNFTEE